MNRRRIQRELRKRFAAAPPPAENFWADFRNRAAALPRTPAAVREVRARPPAVRRAPVWALAALLVLLGIGAGVIFGLARQRSAGAAGQGRTVAAVPAGPAANAALSSVNAVDVRVDYDSVIIMNDASHGTTLVWIDGMSTTRPAGGG